MQKFRSFSIPSSIAGIVALACWAFPAGNALATAYTNTTTSGDFAWTTSSNWDPATNYPGFDSADTLVVSGASGVLTAELTQNITFDSLTANANSSNFRIQAINGDRLLTLNSIVANTSASRQFSFFGENSSNGKLSVAVGTLTVDSGELRIGSSSATLPLGGSFFATTTTISSSTHSIQVLGNSAPTISDNQVNLGNLTMSAGDILISATGTGTSYANFVRVNSLAGTGGRITLNTGNPAHHLAQTGTLIIEGTADGNFGGTITNSTITSYTTPALTVIKNGASQQTFSGSNTYRGGTTITGGSLLLSGNGTLGNGDIAVVAGSWDISGITAATYTLSADQTLSGAGTVVTTGKTLAIAGVLAPGNSPGTLTIDGGTLDISGAASLDFELGTLSDSVLLTGNAGLNIGTLDFEDFNFTPIAGFGGGSYTLFSGWDAFSGTIGTASGTVGGLPTTLSFDGNSLVLDVIPEPNSAVLIGLAAGALLALRRRRGRG